MIDPLSITCAMMGISVSIVVAIQMIINRRSFRVECGWCRAELKPGKSPTTHGICQTCKEFELNRYDNEV